MKESSIVESFIRTMKKRFGGEPLVIIKRHGTVYGSTGWPDVMILLRGKHIEIEFKAPGKKPGPLQLHRLQELREAGGWARWFDSATTAMMYVEIALQQERRRPGKEFVE